jgi:hypothetical protein
LPSLRNVKYRDLVTALERKVGLDFRQGKERNAKYELDGKVRLRVTAPKKHGADVHPGIAKAIRNQLALGTAQFLDLVNCPMTGPDFEEVVREKIRQGLL